MVTAAAHIITSVIGSGVLSLAWAVAQLGWIAGSVSLILFSIITLFTSHLLADCYRSSQTGKRNYSYMDVVNSNLGNSFLYFRLDKPSKLQFASIFFLIDNIKPICDILERRYDLINFNFKTPFYT